MESHSDLDNLIVRKLAGTLTPEEELRFNAMLEENEALRAELTHLKRIWTTAGKFTLSPGLTIEERWGALKSKTFNSHGFLKDNSLSSRWLAYAAVITGFIAISLIWLFVPTSTSEIFTSRGETRTVTLPDSSRVRINAESTLLYDVSDWDEERKVVLSGEAFFEVTKSSVPFVVESDQALVKVLGTSFNVKTRNSETEVLCSSGKVRVSKTDQSSAAFLTKGLGVKVNSETVSQIFSIHENQLPGWLTGELRFNQTPISEVFDELERYFGKSIQFTRPNGKLTFTGRFAKPKLDVVLMTICRSAGLTYSVKSDSTIVVK
jgi:transmembrane sensor